MNRQPKTLLIAAAMLGSIGFVACDRSASVDKSDAKTSAATSGPIVSVMPWADVKAKVASTTGKYLVLDLWALW